MKILRIFVLVVILFGLTIPFYSHVQADVTQCADGIDNDKDGGIDKDGLTAPDGTKFPGDKQCVTTTTPCEDGSKTCASAQTTGSGFTLKVKVTNPLKVDTIQKAVKLFMDAVLKIALPFIVVFFIWAGLSFVLARGNPEKLKKAKNMFWYTIIGTLLILGAWTITNAIIGTVNTITG